MAELTEDKVPRRIRDLFNKGFTAIERDNLDYAIDTLFTCIEMEPRYLRARGFLRAAEIKRAGSGEKKKGGLFSRLTSSVGGMPQYVNTMNLIRQGKAEQALLAAEKLLRDDPLNPKFIRAFVDAVDLAGLPEAAVQTLEMIQQHMPDTPEFVELLGDFYVKVGDTKSAKEWFEKLCVLRPNDPAATKKLKDALAVNSLQKDGWERAESGGSYREMIKDQDEAAVLEKQSKAFKSEDDADVLIRDMQARIEAEPGNINYYRHLSRLYAQKKMFDESVATIEKAIAINPGDPELDNTLVAIRTQKFDSDIAQHREAGREEAAQQLELEKAQFVFDDLQTRVQRYPNDLELRFRLGIMLFENDYINESIQQFQLAQRNPRNRTRALYYLAMCFKAKKQYDLAVQQLETAGAELVTMDATKKDILYEMGDVYALLGNRAKAAECFKHIYQVDIGYRDVAEKVEKTYSGT